MFCQSTSTLLLNLVHSLRRKLTSVDVEIIFITYLHLICSKGPALNTLSYFRKTCVHTIVTMDSWWNDWCSCFHYQSCWNFLKLVKSSDHSPSEQTVWKPEGEILHRYSICILKLVSFHWENVWHLKFNLQTLVFNSRVNNLLIC